MLSEERRAHIAQQVREAGFVHAGELATSLAVSRATVWRDIDQLARAGVVAKVHGGAAAPAGQSTPSASGRGAGKGLTIGMQVPTSEYYFRAVTDGARRVCESFGARLVVAVSGYSGSDEDLEAVEGLVGVGVDGLLLTPAAFADTVHSGVSVDVLKQLDLPTVLIERDLAGIGGPTLASVITAREAGVFAAVQHLHDLGHRRIGMVTIGHQSRSRDSILAGYRAALADFTLVDVRDSDSWVWVAGSQVAPLVAQLRRAGMTAVVVFGDTLAIALAHEAHRQGLSIPRDLSIVAYDDEIAADASPPLAAVSPQREVMGETAARWLLGHLSGGEPLGGRRLQIEPRLVLRESTCSPPA